MGGLHTAQCGNRQPAKTKRFEPAMAGGVFTRIIGRCSHGILPGGAYARLGKGGRQGGGAVSAGRGKYVLCGGVCRIDTGGNQWRGQGMGIKHAARGRVVAVLAGLCGCGQFGCFRTLRGAAGGLGHAHRGLRRIAGSGRVCGMVCRRAWR